MGVDYNPMTGTRRDLEVTHEEGAAAVQTHARWVAARLAYLETILADPGLSAWVREIYERERGRLRA